MNKKQIITGLVAILLSASSLQAANGTSTIFWQNAAGKVATWEFISEDFAGKVPLPSKGVHWELIGVADFNWNGQTDLLWANKVTGRIEISLMENGNEVAVDYLRSAPSFSQGWKLLGVADLNEDSSPDLLWSRPNGQMILWQMDGTTFVQASWFNEGRPFNPAWRLAAIADMTGDAKNDLLWQHADGRVAVSQLEGMTIQGSTLLHGGKRFEAWKLAGTVDFNGDDQADLLWRHRDGHLAFSAVNGVDIAQSQLVRNGISVSHGWRIVGVQ